MTLREIQNHSASFDPTRKKQMTTDNQTLTKWQQLWIDILITAIEGGCNYWAAIIKYKHSVVPAFATIIELQDSGEESLGEVTVTSEDIGKVVGKIAVLIKAGESGSPIRFLGQNTIQAVREAMKDPENADFDADTADQILQLAFFGVARGGIELETMEIVYG